MPGSIAQFNTITGDFLHIDVIALARAVQKDHPEVEIILEGNWKPEEAQGKMDALMHRKAQLHSLGRPL